VSNISHGMENGEFVATLCIWIRPASICMTSGSCCPEYILQRIVLEFRLRTNSHGSAIRYLGILDGDAQATR
jgi:hypothetical protein